MKGATVADEKVTLHLERSRGMLIAAPVSITDEPDNGFEIFAVEVPARQVELWKQALAVYEGIQREMFLAWHAGKQAEDARVEAEDRAAADRHQAALAAEKAKQAKLDAEIGPREWVKITRQRPKSHHDVLVHRASCPAVTKAARNFVSKERLRLPDAVAFLMDDLKREKNSFDDGARPCGTCGRELGEAWELMVATPDKPNPTAAPGHPWF